MATRRLVLRVATLVFRRLRARRVGRAVDRAQPDGHQHVDDAVLVIARRQFGVFSREQAFAAGASVRFIERRLASGAWIRLDNAVMAALGSAMESGEFWKSTSGLAHDSNDRIIYETDTGWLNYDSNGTSAGGATHIAHLAPNLALTASDFFVV